MTTTSASVRPPLGAGHQEDRLAHTTAEVAASSGVHHRTAVNGTTGALLTLTQAPSGLH